MLSKELFNEEVQHLGLTYTPMPVTKMCSTCHASVWGTPHHAHKTVAPGKMYCWVCQDQVDPYDPPCAQYRGFQKANTLYVDFCWRDAANHELSIPPPHFAPNGRRGHWIYSP